MAGEQDARTARTRLWNELKQQQPSPSSAEEINDERLIALIREFNAQWAEELKRIESRFPPDPPNAACHHAVIKGLEITNSTWVLGSPPTLPAPGDVVDFFQVGSESIKIWTDKKDHESKLLVVIEPMDLVSGIWRTVAVLLDITIALSSMQEHSQDTGYAWIYHFDPKSPFETQELLEEDDKFRTGTCTFQTIDYWFERAHILELLIRSEEFFVASQLLCQSFKSHWFCLECALRPRERRHHDHPEPDLWNLAASIPAMENGILQATRSVEALLGKPGNRENTQKLERANQRWRESIILDPDAEFSLVQKSYLEYYYDLFEKRGFAAHSYGRLPPDLRRADAVAAQTFAHKVVHSRFERDAVSPEEAQARLQFNSLLVENADRSIFGRGGGTKLTRGSTSLPERLAT